MAGYLAEEVEEVGRERGVVFDVAMLYQLVQLPHHHTRSNTRSHTSAYVSIGWRRPRRSAQGKHVHTPREGGSEGEREGGRERERESVNRSTHLEDIGGDEGAPSVNEKVK